MKESKRRAQLNQQAQQYLRDVPSEFVFWCHDGRCLKNLKELGDALNAMSHENFVFHANSEKNDFARWVQDVIKEDRLATELQKAPDQVQAAKLVASRVSLLSKRTG